MLYNNVCVTQGYHHQDVRKGTHFYWGKGVKGNSLLIQLSFVVFFVGLLLGMCESVRTRNTLYEVGAAKSKIWHNAVVRRKDENRKREKK
jgi:hypothetical protein